MALQNLREELILAGIRELYRSGVQNFSVRRVATACGVSCATPYKHFKDRQSFLAGIVEYIQAQWGERQRAVLEKAEGESTRRKILAVSLEYVRFLVENPYFRSVIMLKDESLDARYAGKNGISAVSQELVDQYCREVDMPERTMRLKLYIVRSLIYGAALLFDNGEIAKSDENMELVAYAIDREFDLP